MMGVKNSERLYSTIMGLHDELEQSVVLQCEQMLKNVVHTAKISLLGKIRRLLDEELAESLYQNGGQSTTSTCHELRCSSCNERFIPIKTESVESSLFVANEGRGIGRQDTNCHLFENEDSPYGDCDDHPIIPDVINSMVVTNFKNSPAELISLGCTETSAASADGDGAMHFPNFLQQEDMITFNNVPQVYSDPLSTANDTTSDASSAKSRRLSSSRSRTQKKSKKFKCQYCSYKTIKRYNLNCHVRLHTGERPFRCELCTKTFSHQSNFAVHVRRYHPTRK